MIGEKKVPSLTEMVNKECHISLNIGISLAAMVVGRGMGGRVGWELCNSLS